MDSLSSELGHFIQSNSSTFTCGGSIPIKMDASPGDSSSPPVTIRWDSPTDSGAPVHFPVIGSDETSFRDLVNVCTPAGFGRGGQDVMDPEYRTAIKLDSSNFSTNLCPYSLGIMDKVTSVLLPNMINANIEGIMSRGIVVAELYKLNIYEGPSGFFKSHVDTPRTTNQFGSLVICLPYRHEGGQLTVKHGKHEVAYNWDDVETADALQWAAFYSDCEHEVHQVTKGHRVTLTYNLYSTPRPHSFMNHLSEPPAPVEIMNLPLYQKIEEVLKDENFMTDGGVLGIYSSHTYPHSPTADNVADKDDIVLKGSDMVLYAVFRSLGLRVKIRPVVPDLTESVWDGECEVDESVFIGRDTPGRVTLTAISGSGEATEVWLSELFDETFDINWITPYQWPEMGIVNITYGNEPGIDCMYTFNALLIEIPSAEDRWSGKSRH